MIIFGLGFVGIGSWHLVNGEIQLDAAFKKAKEIVKSNPIPVAKNKVPNVLHPKTGDSIGILEIPKIKAELPIVEGTNPDDLEKGVGHYKGSYFPDDHGQIVLSGHRDTVFRRAGELKIGDTVILQLSYGTFSYKITHTKIVKANDTSIITLQHQQEELVLTTCYPFHYIGNAPNRYIIYAKPKSSQ
ncbi:class D sortase [Bacillus sp. BRMEA1]|nr:class D sortase [Neobacillus endophyticus]NRD76043.1 class D sortase [Neobacillus endophyticus]